MDGRALLNRRGAVFIMNLKAQQEGFVAALLAHEAVVHEGARAFGLQALAGVKGASSQVLDEGSATDTDSEGHAGLDRGLLAYRLNAQALSAKVLAGVYAGVEAQLGADGFRAMAWQFWRQCPPSQGDLGLWGEQLPAFLGAQQDMDVWLVDLARLEWAAHKLERAEDGQADASTLQPMAALEPERLGLRLQPGLQVLQVSQLAWQLWLSAEVHGVEVDDAQALSVLLWRQSWRVQGRLLRHGEGLFLQALQAGASLDAALVQAGPDFDFSLFLQDALRSGILQGAFEMVRTDLEV